VLLKIALLLGAAVGGIETSRIHYPFGNKPLPRWTGGALVGWERPAPLFYAFDKSGLQVGNITITVPQASEISVRRVTRGADGSYAAGGIAYLNTGPAAFLWRISADGQQQRAFPTLAYIPLEVTIAADGMIWTAGVEKETAKLEYENYVEHDIIRRFRPDGQPAGSWLRYPELKSTANTHPAHPSFLIATRDRVGWYPDRGRDYFEFSLEGEIIGRYPAAPMGPRQQLKGFALCDDGGAYASRETYRERGGAELWEVLALDRKTGTWNLVANTPKSKWGWIYGCEGDRVVSWSRGEGPGVVPLDFWKPEIRALTNPQ
jgi:hypothetical protein